MLYAKDGLEPTKGATSTCPGCGGEVVARCGRINVHHWAHKSTDDCDPWYEPESFWHKGWKEKYPKECREVVMENHRADLVIDGKVIELQNSPISVDELEEREAFYDDMVWLVNGEKFSHNIGLREWRGRGITHKFGWRYFHKRWFYASKPVFIDLGERGIFEIVKVYHSGVGVGRLYELIK